MTGPTLNTYLLEPHDPLLIRDGRSFGAGESARSLPFVPPTTLIGLIRTLEGSRTGQFDRSEASLKALLERSLKGPLLTRLTDDGSAPTLYVPAPNDAVLFGEDGHGALHQLLPASLPEGALLDNDAENLWPLLLPGAPGGKPASMPQFWPWAVFEAWLSGRPVPLGRQGVRLEQAERTHVSLDPATGTAADGQLFGTSALEFTGRAGERYALSFQTDAQLPAGAVPFGGERRLSVLHAAGSPDWPGCPEAVRTAIAETGRARMILLTPAVFTDGWKPRWLLDDAEVKPKLRAAAVGRPLTLSGWDLALNRPKPTRRLAPEGSVYYLELDGTAEQRRIWADRTWLAGVSDAENDRRDGLGLAVLGVWGDA